MDSILQVGEPGRFHTYELALECFDAFTTLILRTGIMDMNYLELIKPDATANSISYLISNSEFVYMATAQPRNRLYAPGIGRS